MEGNDQPPGILAFQQVALQGQAVRGANGHILPWVALQRFLSRLTLGIEAAVRLFARHVKILAVAGDLPIHSQIGQSLAGPAAHRRSAHAHTGQSPQGDGRRRLFLHSGSAFPFSFKILHDSKLRRNDTKTRPGKLLRGVCHYHISALPNVFRRPNKCRAVRLPAA